MRVLAPLSTRLIFEVPFSKMHSMSPDDFSFPTAHDYLGWFDREMPLSKLPLWSTLITSIAGGVIGIICSLVVNCALVEISTSPFFTLVCFRCVVDTLPQYFGCTFLVIGIVILWRLTVSTTDIDNSQRRFLRYFATMVCCGSHVFHCLI